MRLLGVIACTQVEPLVLLCRCSTVYKYYWLMLFACAPHSFVAFSISENPRTRNENEAVYLPRLID